ncbi:MAG: SagB/ThcOx family dehydrogenase [Nanobdellota archaeon]
MTTFKELHEKTNIFSLDGASSKFTPKSWVKIYFKSYPRFKKINLPEPNIKSDSLFELILKRKSRREFNKKPITIKELSTLLFFSAGITNSNSVKSLDDTRRAYPSAGARFPIEIYVAVQNCVGVEPGIYHYDVLSHSLELLIKEIKIPTLNKFISQDMVLDSAVLIMISSPYDRAQIKYGARSFRYVYLDAGHLAQNMYLVAENLNLGCCTIGGFTDDGINEFLDFPDDEKIIYMGVIGKYD